MSAKSGKQRRRSQSTGRRLKTAISHEARAAHAEVQSGLRKMEKSIAEIRRRATRAGRFASCANRRAPT